MIPIRSILLMMALFACAPSHHPSDPKPSDLVESMRARQALAMTELASMEDGQTHWPWAQDCDQTLWAGEARAAGANADLNFAEYAAGDIHRRPLAQGECYPMHSATSVSNDMILGYMVGRFAGHDLAALNRLADYGESHQWTMGVPSSELRVHLSSTGAGLLGRAIEAMGGGKKPYGIVPDPCVWVAEDYEEHVQVLGIYFDGEVSGGVTDVCLARLKQLARDRPSDAFFQAVAGIYTGDEDAALALLTADTYQCPSYVRGADSYCAVHRAFAGSIVLTRFGDQ